MSIQNASRRTLAILLILFPLGLARAAALDFEIFVVNTVLSNQYPGATFANAIVLTTGINLNEFEFPPHAGANVASDNNGPIAISFSSSLRSVKGYFTYRVPLTIQAFDSTNNSLGTVSSGFANNEALSGVAGSHPSELLKVSATTGIRKVVISGDPAGTSFTVDDLTPISSCDIDEDGNTGVTDVQAILNQVQGTATANSDLNADGVVNIVDVQMVINAALQLGCSAK